MGFFDIFKKGSSQKKQYLQQRQAPIKRNSSLTSLDFFVHPDLTDLIWIGDGPKKNISDIDSFEKTYENDYIKMSIGMAVNGKSIGKEPSVIYNHLPVEQNNGIVDRPPYFPNYAALTPHQRYKYWEFLGNPYSGNSDIGYVFLLYYGLERHLLKGNYENAFDVILKLRNIYNNKSFQSYSANALLFSAIIKFDKNNLQKFINSINKKDGVSLDPHIYFLIKLFSSPNIDAKDLIQYHKTFEFTNNRYIKNYPELFESLLTKTITKNQGIPVINLSDFKNQSTKEFVVSPFANMSLGCNSYCVPDVTQNKKFTKLCFSILSDTHEEVKQILKEQRKHSEIIYNTDSEKRKSTSSKPKNILDNSIGYLSTAKIKRVPMPRTTVEDKAYFDKYYNIYQQALTYEKNGDTEKALNLYLKILTTYYPKGDAYFKRPAILLTKNKRFADAIEVCNMAIDNTQLKESQINDFIHRKESLQKRIVRINSQKKS